MYIRVVILMKINATTLLFSSIKMCYTKKLVKMKGYHIVYGKEITKSRCCVCSGSALLCIVGKCLSMCEDRILMAGDRRRGQPDPVCGIPVLPGGNLYISDRKFS